MSLPVSSSSFRASPVSPAESQKFLSTGSEALDSMLGGGVCTGELTELFGLPGTGRTQLLFTLARSASRLSARSILLDTGGGMHSERILEIGASPALCHVERLACASDALSVLPHTLPIVLEQQDSQHPVRLLALNSLSAVRRSCEHSHASRRLHMLAVRLAVLAARFDCAIVLVNDARPPEFLTGSVPNEQVAPKPALGPLWENACSTRIALSVNNEGDHIATLTRSMRRPQAQVAFAISEKGVVDVES